jgi:hypothetical protein
VVNCIHDHDAARDDGREDATLGCHVSRPMIGRVRVDRGGIIATNGDRRMIVLIRAPARARFRAARALVLRSDRLQQEAAFEHHHRSFACERCCRRYGRARASRSTGARTALRHHLIVLVRRPNVRVPLH